MADNKDDRIIVNAEVDMCPCGSGKRIVDCCISERKRTTPKPPPTGHSHPKCYARELGDCSSKISKEHFVSRAVTRLIETPEGKMTLSGPKWLPQGEERRISIGSLGASILCRRHNEALNGLDDVAQKFFEYLMPESSVSDAFLMINGGELERWMLKVLCGFLASGMSIHSSDSWRPPLAWLRILFDIDNIPNGSGMYVLRGKDITDLSLKFRVAFGIG